MTELGRGLRALGHEVVICTHRYEPSSAFAHGEDEFEVLAVSTGAISPPASFIESQRQQRLGMPALGRLVPDDVDLINAHEAPAHIAGRIASKRLGKPWVWTRNDFTLYEYTLMPEETLLPRLGRSGRLMRRAIALPDRRAGRAADRIVVLDQRNAQMVRRAYGQEASVVRSGPAEKFFDPPERDAARQRLAVVPGDFLVLAVGILMPYRRFEDLIDALPPLGDIPNLRVRIVGSDHLSPEYGQALSRRIEELGLGDRVSLVKRSVSEDELRDGYAAADLFVFPNDKQTWGLAPLEALASGTPAVVSRGAGVHEVLEGRAGVTVVDPQSPGQIGDALRSAGRRLGDVDLRATREWIRSELSNQRYAARMAEIFEELRS